MPATCEMGAFQARGLTKCERAEKTRANVQTCKMSSLEAGIDVELYKGAALRMASANANLDAGEDIHDVMFRGRWKSMSVFKQFYERQQRKIQLPASVMSQIIGH